MGSFDISRFRARPLTGDDRQKSRAKNKLVRRFHGEFLKGPIPLSWLSCAAKLPGKALHVALAIWFEYGRRKRPSFRLTTAVLKRFNVARKAGYHALEALTREKLIDIQRQRGKNPTISLILPPTSDEATSKPRDGNSEVGGT
ncbi:MAG: hypothetical protein QOD99_2651 [Chthoniobacter sp.]|jgi:hypothetical protein|nr:hypothetical protein [Chthoniobacter sp.]